MNISSPQKSLDVEWSGLLFGIRRSIRYHTHRRRFFDKLSAWSDVLIILSGGSVVGFICAGQPGHWAIFFGAVSSIIATFDLVLGFTGRARDHHDLCREFSALEREMIAGSDQKTSGDLSKFTNRRLEIEDEEPPTLQVLNAYCHNEMILAEGTPKKYMAKIRWYQSLLKQWCDIQPQSVDPTLSQ